MAVNQYANKVEYNGNTLIDLTNDTLTTDKALEGCFFHSKTGERVEGECKAPYVQNGILYLSNIVNASVNNGVLNV